MRVYLERLFFTIAMVLFFILYFLLFTIIYPKINMNVNNFEWKQFRLGNDLPLHIRENIDFPRQRSRQLPSTEANFEGCLSCVI